MGRPHGDSAIANVKAMVFHAYGGPDVLRLEEVPKPVPREGEVLVKVCATAVNDGDWAFVRGKPHISPIRNVAAASP